MNGIYSESITPGTIGESPMMYKQYEDIQPFLDLLVDN